MGRMKIILAVVGAVFVLLGVAATATMRSDSSPNRAETVANEPSAATAPPTGPVVASDVPATQTAPLATIPAQSTTPDLERIMAAITASMAPPPGTSATTAPLTREQVEAQLREQLRMLGITY